MLYLEQQNSLFTDHYHRQHLQIFESFTFYLDLRIHSSISMCLICCSKYFTLAMVNFYYYTRHGFVIPMQTCYFLGVSVVKPICAAMVNIYFNTYIYFTQHNIYFNIDFSPSMVQKMPIQENPAQTDWTNWVGWSQSFLPFGLFIPLMTFFQTTRTGHKRNNWTTQGLEDNAPSFSLEKASKATVSL